VTPFFVLTVSLSVRTSPAVPSSLRPMMSRVEFVL